MLSYDVGIVGLGAMGSAAAWHLARRGARVIGIDRYTPPHHFGSSHGRSRIIREAYFEHPLYVPLVQRAYELWDVLSAMSATPLLTTTGGLTIGHEGGALVTGALESARAHHLTVERWSAATIRARVPALAVPDGYEGVWEPRAGMLAPEAAIEAWLAGAREAGAELVFDTAVSGWEAEPDGIRVATPAQDYLVGRLIVAAGAWTAELTPGLALPLTVERAVQFWMRAADEALHRADRLPVFVIETAPGEIVYGLPDVGHGVKVARHYGGEITTPDAVTRIVRPEERRDIRARIAPWLPGLSGDPIDASVCLYTNTPDHHFVIDRDPSEPRVIVASPCSGHGFKFAPAIGEILADLALDMPPRVALAPFSLARFGARP